MDEIWKDITGYEGIYQVSNYGNVKAVARTLNDGRFRKERMLKPYIDRDGYKKATLWYGNNPQKHYFVHRLVALAFIDNPDNYPQINHKDENPANNHVENLEWCDVRYNINYGNRNIKMAQAIRGENHYLHKLKNEDIRFIRDHYIRGHNEYGQCAMARKYGVCQSVIRSIINRKTWKHI